MSTDQEHGLRILDNALWRIARHGDCDYLDNEESRPTPCDCPRCIAVAALETAKNWRFHGAHHARIGNSTFPRETRMQASWVKLASDGPRRGAPDQLLSQILNEEGRSPSVRDWYVATSVIQWLATNVGMTVLEGAGFKYQQWDQGREDNDNKRRKEAKP